MHTKDNVQQDGPFSAFARNTDAVAPSNGKPDVLFVTDSM